MIILPQNGAPTPTAGPSTRAPGIKFNSSSDFYCTTQLYPILAIPGDVTVCFWFATTATGTFQCFVGEAEASGGGNNTYCVTLNFGSAGKVQFWGSAAGPDFGTATTGLNDGLWRHIAVSRSGGTSGRIYLNGKLDNTGTTQVGNTTALSVHRFAINQFGGFNGYRFAWSGADIRVYNRVLSDAEVAAIYGEAFLPEGIFWPGIDALGWIPPSPGKTLMGQIWM
jgi:hypothetical protein